MRRQSMRKRVATCTAVALLGSVGASSLGMAPAAAAVPAAQTTTAFCVNVPAGFGGFTDIATTIHRKPIECLAFAGITSGKTETTYAPRDAVTRGQMASFIARAIDKANELENLALPALPASPPDKFADDTGSIHEPNINRLAAAGVVGGKTATTFAPNEIVTRAQMASFISNAQKFLAGGTGFTSSEDFFVDDEGNVHEANINGIAAAGVTAGIDSTHYGPSLPVLRANMATFIARYLAVLHKNGVIDELPAEAPSNATITFTPTTDERRTIAPEPTQVDDRTYTASGLTASPHRVTLFDAATVTIDPGPVYTFTEEGNTGIAAPGTVGGTIVAVNGLPVTPAQSVGSISPVNGTITVTVDSVSYGKLLPVIHTDQGGSTTQLELADNNRPTEPFGAAGQLESIPEAAVTGVLGEDATVLMADETADLIAAQLTGSQRTFLYDSNDTFFRDSVSVANQLTLAQFEAALSKGDRLDATTSYNANPALVSSFVLENVSPAPPTATVASVSSTSAVITISDLIAGATAKVYLGPDGAAFAASPLKATSALDASPGTAGFQVNLTGLTPSTSYEFYVTQTVEGEESDPATKVAGPATSLVTPAAIAPTVTSAAFQGGRQVLVLNFSEAITPITSPAAAAAKVSVSCVLIVIPTSTTAGASLVQLDVDTLVVTLAAPVPNDGVSTCTAGISAGAVQDADNAPNGAQSGIAIA